MSKSIPSPPPYQIEQHLRSVLVGQDRAIEALLDAYRLYYCHLAPPHRPVAALMFIGPTGCGKTRSVEALAESLYGSPRAMLKVDCGEYQDHHEVAKLIGAPPGYLGHRETQPLLSLEYLRQFHRPEELSIILFDEVEKAHRALWDLLLGILDKGEVCLGDNRHISYENAIVVLTGNVGAREIHDTLSPTLGFHRAGAREGSITSAAKNALRRTFAPEFINRLDDVIVFRPLERADLERILELELTSALRRLTRACGVRVTVEASAREQLLEEGTDRRYGARPLRRAVEARIVRALARSIAAERLSAGDHARIWWDGEWHIERIPRQEDHDDESDA